MLILRTAARRVGAAVGLVLILTGLGQVALMAPAQANPNEACIRYHRLEWGRTQGVTVPDDIMTIAKQLCDQHSQAADQVPLSTNYSGDPCDDYRRAKQTGASGSLEILGTECVGTYVRAVNAVTSTPPSTVPTDTAPSSDSGMPGWACLLIVVVVVGGGWILFYGSSIGPNPPTGGEGSRWGPQPPTLPRK